MHINKCSLSGCGNKPVGGFMQIIEVSTVDQPNEILPGGRTFWCKTHQVMLESTTWGKPGRLLGTNELA